MLNPSNDNRPDGIKQLIGYMHLGQQFGDTADAIYARAIAEKWTEEQAGQAINEAMFGRAK